LEKEHSWALPRIAEERESAGQELSQLKLDLARAEAGARDEKTQALTDPDGGFPERGRRVSSRNRNS
jgi:hypothetical protein